MVNDQEAYFKALEALFETAGWKVLIEEIEDSVAKAVEHGADAPDWGTVQYFKGRRHAFEELLTLPATIHQHQEALAEAENDDADL